MSMSKRKKLLLVTLGILCAVVLAFLIWCNSGGPAWMARRTAERYLERYEPEYSFVDFEVIEGMVCYNTLGFLSIDGPDITWPSWVVTARAEVTCEAQWMRLELSEGWFPLAVTKAAWKYD